MRLLLIEDDTDLCRALRISLEKDGFALDISHNGSDGLEMMQYPFYSVVILDRMLPERDGLSVLKAARSQGIKTPVLLLTALGSVPDRVDGLEAGADDYLVKPFDTRELLARIRALSRRKEAQAAPVDIVYGDLQLQPEEFLLAGPAKSVKLSRKECLLTECLLKSDGKLLSRDYLIGAVWGADDVVEDANLDTYICFLRRRFTNIKSQVKVITVRGCGYRLETAEEQHD